MTALPEVLAAVTVGPNDKAFDTRWQCPRGHFVADASIRTEDFPDAGEYYGIRTEWEYDCRACAKTYAEAPRVAVLGHVDPPAELGCWRTTPEGREWQADVQAAVLRGDAECNCGRSWLMPACDGTCCDEPAGDA